MFRKAMMIAAIGCATALPAAAQEAVSLANPTPDATAAFTVGVTRFVGEVRLRNAATGAGDGRSLLTGSTLRRASDGLTVSGSWRRLDAAAQERSLAPGGQAVLQLTADLPEAGVFETWVDTAYKAADGTEKADHRIKVAVTREVEPVPADFIVDPHPLRGIVWPFGWFGDGERQFVVELHNGSAKPIEFGAPQWLQLTNDSGDQRDAYAPAKAPRIDASRCQSPLAPGARCSIDVAWSDPPPGQYGLDLGVSGNGGGGSRKTVKVSVRYNLFVAFLAIIVGVLAGFVVQYWRSRGRRAFDGLATIGSLRERLRRLTASGGADPLAALETPLADELEGLETRCRAGADIAADLDRVGLKLTQIAAAATLERPFAALPAPAQALLGRQRAAFIARTAAPVASDADRAALDGMRRTLAANINAWPRFDAAARDAKTTLAFAARAQTLAPDDDALAAATKALRDAQARAFAQIDPQTLDEAIDQRADDLVLNRRGLLAALNQTISAVAARYVDDAEQARSKGDAAAKAAAETRLAALAKFDGLADLGAQLDFLEKARRAALGGAASFEVDAAAFDVAVPGQAPGLDLPVAPFLDLATAGAHGDLRRRAVWIEIATNLAVLIATGLAGVALLATNQTWGAGVDVGTALLGGFGARIALGQLGALDPTAATGK